MSYVFYLTIISILFIILERLYPLHASQKVFRKQIFNDIFYLFFNGHYLSIILIFLSLMFEEYLKIFLDYIGLSLFNLDLSSYLQVIIAIVVLDFIQWVGHNLLHRIPFLWQFHKIHHSIVELDWIGSLRFHWAEIIFYKTIQYIPLYLLGFSEKALFITAIFGTFMGHFNHSNIRINIGKLGYIFNSPQMHIWHHNNDEGKPKIVNLGISLSLWDFIFKTSYMPGSPPKSIGLPSCEMPPKNLLKQLIWPIKLW